MFLQVGLGIGLTFLLHLVVGGGLIMASAVAVSIDPNGPIGALVGMGFGYWAIGVGVVQLVYVVPVAIPAAFVRRPIALGMVIGAALTFVLQGACYGLGALTMGFFIAAEAGMF
ncbi:MAG: hypothetical protein KC621_09560 [Myxococcales bacterium]|nr:hypothetical protein [Myxococcales bacterium]